MELDGSSGFNVSVKKETILAVSETLKYMKTPYEDMVFKCRSNNWAIDIDRQANITILDILNYRLFINRLNYDDKSNKNNYILNVSHDIKPIILHFSVATLKQQNSIELKYNRLK